MLQDENYNYLYDANDSILVGTSITDAKFKDFDNINQIQALPKGHWGSAYCLCFVG